MTSGKKKVSITFDGNRWYSKDATIAFKAGTTIDIEVDEQSLIDKNSSAVKLASFKVRVFNEGDELLVALKTPSPEKEIDKNLKKAIIESANFDFCDHSELPGRFNLSNYSFVKLRLKQAESQSMLGKYDDLHGTGWFEVLPFKKGRIHCGVIELPSQLILDSVPKSLNHAYTLLSELIEPERLSHTGNIYDLIFYKEKNEQWFPLNRLRSPKSSDSDDMRVSQLWKEIKKRESIV